MRKYYIPSNAKGVPVVGAQITRTVPKDTSYQSINMAGNEHMILTLGDNFFKPNKSLNGTKINIVLTYIRKGQTLTLTTGDVTVPVEMRKDIYGIRTFLNTYFGELMEVKVELTTKLVITKSFFPETNSITINLS